MNPYNIFKKKCIANKVQPKYENNFDKIRSMEPVYHIGLESRKQNIAS